MGGGANKTWTWKYLKYLNDIFWYKKVEFYSPQNLLPHLPNTAELRPCKNIFNCNPARDRKRVWHHWSKVYFCIISIDTSHRQHGNWRFYYIYLKQPLHNSSKDPQFMQFKGNSKVPGLRVKFMLASDLSWMLNQPEIMLTELMKPFIRLYECYIEKIPTNYLGRAETEQLQKCSAKPVIEKISLSIYFRFLFSKQLYCWRNNVIRLSSLASMEYHKEDWKKERWIEADDKTLMIEDKFLTNSSCCELWIRITNIGKKNSS